MNGGFSDRLRGWWERHRLTVLRSAVVVLAVFAVLKLGTEFYRLLGESRRQGAVDLHQRHTEVHQWFAGQVVYGAIRTATYPPASYAILWPLVGWLEFTPVRWLWAASTVAAIGWLIYLIVRDSGATTRLERVFVALLLLSMNATGVAIGNGQLPLHVLPALVAGLVLLQRARGQWREELAGSVLILAAFVKPNMAIPFFWLVLVVPRNFRPALLVGVGCVALTLLAASFQEAGLVPLLRDWVARGVATSTRDSVQLSYGNLHSWAAALGLERWNTPASLGLLAALGGWVYHHRHSDLWRLLGVTALVARLWTYHGLYDDVLILLPMVALFRIAKQSPATDGAAVIAGVLLAITTLAMLAPARLFHGPPPGCWLFSAGHTMVWGAIFIFLLDRTWRDLRRRGSS